MPLDPELIPGQYVPQANQPDKPRSCPICSTLPLDNPPIGPDAAPVEYFIGRAQPEFDTIFEKTKKGRRPCTLWNLVDHLDQFWSGQEAIFDFEHYLSTCRPPSSDDWNAVFRIRIDTDSEKLLPPEVTKNSISVIHPNPLSAPMLERIRRWIDTCYEHHEECDRKTIPILPSRILNVGKSQGHPVRLIETNGQRDIYVALSHCWGKSKPFTTTHSTLQAMKTGFQVSDTPKTFQDAILVTRELGIHYLWIDSLCIIQDDPGDWETESVKMGSIYRDAYFTIAASNSSSDSEGFLKPRPFNCMTVNVISPKGDSIPIYLEPGSIKNENQFQPLDLRGWTLQEGYLSRRVLKFQSHDISWRCQFYEFYEGVPDTRNAPKSNFPIPNVERLYPLNWRDENSYIEWYSMVSKFTKRNLSFDRDKLPALFGIATVMTNHTKGKYCAGIWWNDIPKGLYWTAVSTLSKPAKYVAPSWSWASVNGPVQFHHYPGTDFTYEKLESVIFKDVHIAPKGESLYGEVVGGWISLQAPAVKCKRTGRKVPMPGLGGGPRSTLQDPPRDRLAEYLQIDGIQDISLELDFIPDFRDTIDSSDELLAVLLENGNENVKPGGYRMPGIMTGQFKYGKFTPNSSLIGLVVQSVPDESEHGDEKTNKLEKFPQYKRVGLFDCGIQGKTPDQTSGICKEATIMDILLA